MKDIKIYHTLADYNFDIAKRRFFTYLKGTEIFASQKDAIIFSSSDEYQINQINDIKNNEELYYFLKEEYGIEPKYIAGTSMGAIIGVMYAAGYSADEIMQIVKEDRLYKVGRLITMQSALRNSGMSTHKTLLRELAELIPHNLFDSLERKFNGSH